MQSLVRVGYLTRNGQLATIDQYSSQAAVLMTKAFPPLDNGSNRPEGEGEYTDDSDNEKVLRQKSQVGQEDGPTLTSVCQAESTADAKVPQHCIGQRK